MQNFGQNTQRTSILKELSGGNVELGEAFALIINDMVVQSGITNPKAEQFDVVPDSWRKLASKPDKTPDEIKELDTTFKEEIQSLAESYLLFMARETRNLTGKLDYAQYEQYMLKYRFGRYDVMNKPEYLTKIKIQISKELMMCITKKQNPPNYFTSCIKCNCGTLYISIIQKSTNLDIQFFTQFKTNCFGTFINLINNTNII